ncbi:MAG TPA: uroporphyrinogen-III synthase, partial [Chitinophagaceae bacterium]|nr:uroporphyrinogen-III synthase [Chitinophagaceae bacterium]
IIYQISELSKKRITAVFTSMNAVEAIHPLLINNANWQVYCIGHATKKLVAEHLSGASIIGVGNDALSLADTVAADKPELVYFFCGDQRRDELPNKLKSHGIRVEEIVVYKTMAREKKITTDYDGILFFSPSAVHSFFNGNTIGRNVLLFAIGNTTSNAIKKFSQNEIIIADQPGKDQLVRKMIARLGHVQKTD